MTAKERIARETRRAREAPPEAPSRVPDEVVEDVDALTIDQEPTIEFEDRSDDDYRAAVLEVMAALDWVRQQRASGNLPS